MLTKGNKNKKANANCNTEKRTTLPSGVFMTKAQKLNQKALKVISNRY